MDTKKVEKIFNSTMNSKNTHEGVLLIENSNGDFFFKQEYRRNINTPMVMASITKLFTTTCILVLMEKGKLSLKDKITLHLNTDIVKGLHIFRGKDYSNELTIENLLFQTSGLPDFYLDKASSTFKKVKEGDFSYSFEDELKWTKSMKPPFEPAKEGKAYYADVNFDLLGKIIENINGTTLQEAYKAYIFTPLNLKNTYLASKETDFVPHTYLKNQPIERPLFISSSFASGGAITTARELMIFLKAFWKGQLFDKSIFTKLTECNKLQLSFTPIRYCGGYMKINASMPFCKKVKLLGHSGSTGAFAFYCPDKDLFFVGDVPQISDPSICIRLVMKCAVFI